MWYPFSIWVTFISEEAMNVDEMVGLKWGIIE